eukprot:TRINITY_DN6728_c0_g1_i1.p2 TRINITY_DN6728_c0_g1~~TRINITY_DN6728_c0_g1_i1.p2  ORF type:complete len:332 (-),score=80.43 TRINITY_DN6728_c0_g1_i1:146-1141(-)
MAATAEPAEPAAAVVGTEERLEQVTEEELNAVAARIARARRVAVFTGAGMSAESGIPTFRGEGGLWDTFSPSVYGNVPGLALTALFRPGRFAAFLRAIVGTFLGAKPNAGHMALALLEKLVPTIIVTQNVDGLHQAAGSSTVWEVHGSLLRMRCSSCAGICDLTKDQLGDVADKFLNEGWLLPRLITKKGMPPCPTCGGILRPDVVMFGESLPAAAWEASAAACRAADVLIVVGTSASVYPAAELPQMAFKAYKIEINPAPAFPYANCHLKGNASDVLPRLVEAVAMYHNGHVETSSSDEDVGVTANYNDEADSGDADGADAEGAHKQEGI